MSAPTYLGKYLQIQSTPLFPLLVPKLHLGTLVTPS